MNLDFEDINIYEVVIEVCLPYQVHPSSSLEMEQFFTTLLAHYQGEASLPALRAWLDTQMQQYFVAVGERPHWIQDGAWPVRDGKPLMFIGQIDVAIQANPVATRLFHDDTSFYVFIGESGPPVVIMQQY